MKYLNLDKDFTPFGNSIDFELVKFPGGEHHIKIKECPENKPVTITARLKSFNDIGVLLLAVDALKRLKTSEINLFIPYFPGARQDRINERGEALTVKVYADVINSQNFNKVYILDPHSDVTPALINNVEVLSNYSFIKHATAHLQDFVVIAPDAGAAKKAHKVAKELGSKIVVECSKKRDTVTGKLSGFSVHTENLKGKTCVLIDDICDGGGTFLGLASELKAKNAGHLILCVTHGIFSNGLEQLADTFEEIHCTDSFKTINSTLVNQIHLNLNF